MLFGEEEDKLEKVKDEKRPKKDRKKRKKVEDEEQETNVKTGEKEKMEPEIKTEQHKNNNEKSKHEEDKKESTILQTIEDFATILPTICVNPSISKVETPTFSQKLKQKGLGLKVELIDKLDASGDMVSSNLRTTCSTNTRTAGKDLISSSNKVVFLEIPKQEMEVDIYSNCKHTNYIIYSISIAFTH